MNILEIKSLTKSFDGVTALDSLSFSIQSGTITSLIGPNGSGKTTAFNVISGFLDPNSGEVILNGKKITNLSPHKISRLGIGRSFQNIRLFPQISAMENVILALKYDKGEKLLPAILQTKKMRIEDKANTEKARSLLHSVGLGDKERENAENLSHGQRRLVEIARLLALDPQLFLLDEPTAGLFPNMITDIKRTIRELRNAGKTILIVSHDMNVVMDISDRVLAINHGKLIADGTPAEIQSNPVVVEAYLGKKSAVVA